MKECPICLKNTKNKTYCSKECSYKGKVGKPRPDVVIRNKTNNPVWNEAARLKMVKSLTGRKIPDEVVAKRVRTMNELRKKDPTLTDRQIKGLRRHIAEVSVGWKSMREKALTRDNRTCQRCSTSDRKVVVHHIDGQGRNLPSATMMNNELSNLITLCYPCHTHVHIIPSRNDEGPLPIQ